MVETSAQTDIIRSEPRETCFLCGQGGDVLYRDLADRLFGAPGRWNLRRCPLPNCGLVWLDPAPARGEAGKAYKGYYTHGGRPKGSLADHPRWPLRLAQGAYHLWLRATFQYRAQKELEAMYMDAVPPGRVLEVGCGSGERLAKLRKRGWIVQGQEVDPDAAAFAKAEHGVDALAGELDELRLPGDSFDAVLLAHVIEHVHDPVAMLSECRRLLRPGGLLIITTPNAEGFGAKYFGPDWRGWEPPRHLHVFNPRTMSEVARRAGFRNFRCWTAVDNGLYIPIASYALRRDARGDAGRSPRLAILPWLTVYHVKAALAFKKAPGTGDHVVLRAEK